MSGEKLVLKRMKNADEAFFYHIKVMPSSVDASIASLFDNDPTVSPSLSLSLFTKSKTESTYRESFIISENSHFHFFSTL